MKGQVLHKTVEVCTFWLILCILFGYKRKKV